MKRIATIVFALLISVAGLAQVEIIPSGGGVGAVTLDNTATLYNKTLDGSTTVFNGSTTQNFSVATLTAGNIGGWGYVYAQQITSQSVPVGPAVRSWGTEVTDALGEFDGATYTASVSGLYHVDVCLVMREKTSEAVTGELTIYLDSTMLGLDAFHSNGTDGQPYIVTRISRFISMSAGQQLGAYTYIRTSTAASTTGFSGSSFFTVARVR